MFRWIKRFFTHTCILFFIFLVFHSEVSADEIILKNGDRLTGTVTKLEEGVLTLKTEYSEPVKIRKEEIKSISTNEHVKIHLVGTKELKGKLKTDEEGHLSVESSIEREAAIIDWNKVKAINPTPVIPPKWKGNVTLGANLQTGNTDRTSVSVGAEAARKTDQDRFSLRFLHNYAEENDEITVRNTYGSLKYDYFFTRSLYGYLGVELLNDKFRDLNLRTVVGPGIGYQIWDDPIEILLFEAGVSYFSEDLKEGEDDHWITARLAGNFSYKIKDAIVFSEQFILYPSVGKIGEYQLRNEAGVTSALGARWALKFTNILEHDSDPPEGVKKSDLYWILALQYSF